MVLVVDSARRCDWHGNAASTRRFRWNGPHDCGDSFAAGYRHSVIYGPRATLPCGILSISYFRFPVFFKSGRFAFQLRYLLIALVVVSVVINSLTTVSWLLEADYECTCGNEGDVE